MLAKREVFVWKRCHEEVLLAEVSAVEPYKFKAGTKERGKAWREVSENLNALSEMGFKTTHRSVREKFDKMMKDFEGKEIGEKRASGVDVDYSDIDKVLQDIKERIAEVEEEQDKEREKTNKDKVTAEQMRNKAMESLRESRKRSSDRACKGLDSDDDDDENDAIMNNPKRRGSQGGMAEILKDAMKVKKQANEIRQKELELKAEEMKQNQMFLQNILVQRQQFQQQQQAMNQAFLNALANLVNKN